MLLSGVLTALLTLTGSDSGLPEEIASLDARERCTWIVRSIREPEPPLEAPEEALVEAGREVPRYLIELLRAEQVPALDEDQRSQTMSIYQRALILDAAVEIGSGPMIAAATAGVGPSSPVAERAVAIDVLGRVGDGSAFSQVMRLADCPAREELDDRVEQALVRGLSSLVERHPEILGSMSSRWRQWRPDLVGPVLEAVGASRVPDGLAFVMEVASWSESLAPLCLSQVRLIGRSGDPTTDRRAMQIARDYLDPDEPHLCGPAILALGALEDVETVPRLLEMLESESRSLSGNALWALRSISGMALANRPQLWNAWYASESRWFEQTAPGLIERLESPLDHEVIGVLRELGLHPLYRHDLAAAVTPLLRVREPNLRARACRALGRLGSRSALSALVDALDDFDDEVRLAAHEALVRVTGKDRGSEPDSWRAIVPR